jgi:hypothetical protein
MALRFVGVDAESPHNGSPTVWVDEDDGSIVVQGWKITSEAVLAQIAVRGPIPEHETVLKLPVRMAPFLMAACGTGQNADH